MDWKQLATWDEQSSTRLRFIEEEPSLRKTAIFLAHSADPWISLALLLLLWYFSYGEWKQLALVMFIGTLLTAGVVFVIKYSVRRSRPAGDWGQIYRRTNPHSFPSGHAARCMMLTVIAFALSPWWFGAVLCAWTVLVSLARVGMGVHYLSDVLVGIAIGLVIGRITILPLLLNQILLYLT